MQMQQTNQESIGGKRCGIQRKDMRTQRTKQGFLKCQKLLEEFTAASRETLGEALTGIYLHGSLAMGCFNPDKSDVDLLLVTEKEVTDAGKLSFLREVLRLERQGPAKGIELSMVKREVLKPFVYPTPFELHFSGMHREWLREKPEDYVRKMRGLDPDLAAHATMIRQYGITLFGKSIGEVFGEVPREAYVDSILRDVKNAGEDIAGQPVYVILNLCRVLAFLRDGLYLSKQEGGAWGLENLPQWCRPLILEALACYGSRRRMQPEAEQARAFAEQMLRWIEAAYAGGPGDQGRCVRRAGGEH